MRKVSAWNTFVEESQQKDDRSAPLQLPLTKDKTYTIHYPTREQVEEGDKERAKGNIRGFLIALLGEEAGSHLDDLSKDAPAYVLDAYVLEIMQSFIGVAGGESDATEGKPQPPVKAVPTKRSPKRRSSSSAA